MASISKQVIRAVQKYSIGLSNERVITATSVSNFNIQKRYARKIPDYFVRFKVEPRQPISDLVSHELIYEDSDPAPYFVDRRVQDILKDLTGRNEDRVFRHRKYKSINPPRYDFLTEKELEMAYAESEKSAKEILMMPPVMKIREDSTEIVEKDPALEGLFSDKLIITDISADVPDSKRIILVRESDGTLKHANKEQRHRMNCIYNPRKGRTIHTPSLFSMKYLKNVLSQKEYEFVLDRACLQMEPYEATFQSVQAVTFEAIDRENDHNLLLSTRHYGPMVFFLAWNKKLDGLMENMLKNERLDDVSKLLKLYAIVYPDSKIASAEESDPENLLKIYLKEESKNATTLELALQMYKDIQKSKSEYQEEVEKSHGG